MMLDPTRLRIEEIKPGMCFYSVRYISDTFKIERIEGMEAVGIESGCFHVRQARMSLVDLTRYDEWRLLEGN